MKKNNTLKVLLYSFLIVFFVQQNINSQIHIGDLSGGVNTITTAVPFLAITPDSRAGGMGDVGIATKADANSMHWNPAKYSFVDEQFGLSISYTPWLRALIGDISLSYLSGFMRLNRRNVVAVSMRYFSLGNITFTDFTGTTLRDFNPNEFSVDVAYSLLLSKKISGAIAVRYIYSNLTGGMTSGAGTETHPGNAVAGDISFFYISPLTIMSKKSKISAGINFSNIGSKISYTDASQANFLPMNLGIGTALEMDINDFNSITLALDFNKLLVPTPPIYDGQGKEPENIIEGKNPNVSVPAAIGQSFNDAPGGFKEELHEITTSIGLEYWYAKKFAIRTGYFVEHETKGNRKFFTIGLGLKLNVFSLDFAYLMPIQQHNPLENTIRLSLSFNFLSSKDKLPKW